MKDFRRASGGGRENKGFERRDNSSFRSPRPNEHRGGYEGYQGASQTERRDEVLHKATCAECNKTCEVPFRPNGKKPVYCKDCFGAKKTPGGSANRFEKSEFTPRASAPSAPFAREDRPQHSEKRDTRIDDLKAQVDALHTKMDRMMKHFEKGTASAPETKHADKPAYVAPKAAPVVAEKPAVKAAEVKKAVKAAPVAKKAEVKAAPAAKKPAAKVAPKAKPVAKKKK